MLKVLLLLLISFFFFNVQPVWAEGQLTFDPPNISITTNDISTADILVNTDNIASLGVGAKLIYNPKFIEITEIIPGKLFPSYLTTEYNNTTGNATISAIADSMNTKFSGKGILATIKFRGLAPAYTELKFSYTPLSTTDSNIAVDFGNGDILTKVEPLSISITNNTKVPAATTSKQPLANQNTQVPQQNRSDHQTPTPSQSTSSKSFILDNLLIITTSTIAIVSLLFAVIVYIRSKKSTVSNSQPPNL